MYRATGELYRDQMLFGPDGPIPREELAGVLGRFERETYDPARGRALVFDGRMIHYGQRYGGDRQRTYLGFYVSTNLDFGTSSLNVGGPYTEPESYGRIPREEGAAAEGKDARRGDEVGGARRRSGRDRRAPDRGCLVSHDRHWWQEIADGGTDGGCTTDASEAGGEVAGAGNAGRPFRWREGRRR